NTKYGYSPYSRHDMIKEVDRLMLEGKHNNPIEIEEVKKIQLRQLANNYGIFSCSERKNSILMWSHYSNCHSGICIGFETVGFREQTSAHHMNVVYVKNGIIPTIKPNPLPDPRDTALQGIYKSKEWKYEKEHRFFRLVVKNLNDKQERLFIIDRKVIKE